MMVIFRTRLGKILIWQNFKERETPTLIIKCSISVVELLQ